MSLRLVRWLLGACAGVLAACTHLERAAGWIVLPDGRQVSTAVVPPASQPAPRSTLLSNRDLDFRVARVGAGPHVVTYLVHRDVVHGVIVDHQADGEKLRSFHWLSRARHGERESALLDIVAIEYFYVMALAGDAEIRYSLNTEQQAIGSQQALLTALAELRGRMIGHLPQSVAGVMPWVMVDLEPQPGRADQPAVRIRGDRGPLMGATVSFGRAPHSGCEATSDDRGIARCELVDLHGHDRHDDHDAAVVATFAGGTTPTVVLPPTILVIRSPVSFAARWTPSRSVAHQAR